MFRANVYVKTRPPARSHCRSADAAPEPFDVDLAFNAPRENDRVRSEGEGREGGGRNFPWGSGATEYGNPNFVFSMRGEIC